MRQEDVQLPNQDQFTPILKTELEYWSWADNFYNTPGEDGKTLLEKLKECDRRQAKSYYLPRHS